MDVISVFAVISGIVFLGFLSEIIFRKTKIPDVLILIGVGILIGTVFGWADSESFGEGSELFATFALVFILFQGALSIDIKTLIKSLSNTLKLTIINFIFTVLVVSLISYLMGYDFLLALLIGMILGGTSSAVVIPLVSSVDIKSKFGLVLTLESALSDVLCIIGTVTILDIISSGQIASSNIFNSILTSFSLALVVGIISGILWMLLMTKNRLILESYMLTVAAVIGVYAFVESPLVGASGAIAALSFGLVLGNSKTLLQLGNSKENQEKKKTLPEDENAKIIRNVLSTSAKNFYSEISFFVKTFFFVYLGILIDFSDPTVFLYGAILTLGIFLVRPLSVWLVFTKENLSNKDRAALEALIPKGLAAAVLAGLAVQSGILGEAAGEFVNLILSVVLLSIVFTSILVFLLEKNIFKGIMPFLYSSKSKEE